MKRSLATIAMLTLVSATVMASSSLPTVEFVPGKGLMHRWVVDPSIAPPAVAARPGTGGRFGTGGPVGTNITTQSVNDTAPCDDSEFRSVSRSGPSNAALVNRHKYCQEYQSSPELIKVDLMKRTIDSQWEYYRPGVAFYDKGTFDVGRIALRTRIHAFLAGGGLSKAHQIDVNATFFEFDPGFPAHLRAGVSLTLYPNGGATYPSDSNIQNFSIRAGSFAPITLDASTPSGSTGPFDVTFNWTYAGSDPMQNIARLAVGVPSYSYQINNTPNSGFDGLHSITADSSASWAWLQQLRCDKGVASGDAAPFEGCIFVEAAPVFEISATGAAEEEAIHIYHAQRNTDAYKTQLSPGVFKPIAGARAIADESGGPQYLGLERGTEEDRRLNGSAACKDPSSALIRTRPYSGSASCPTLSSLNCECDEYPFASTKQGAYYMPFATSVRGINLSHNRSGGGQLLAFYNSQRVIAGEKFWVRVTGVQ